MATAAVPSSVEPGELECPVCHEDFTQPKILPCAHLLCRDCLVSWVKSEADALCPLCRCAILDSKERGSKSCEEVADGLPTDLAMAALVNSSRTLREDHTCQACVNAPAVSICLNCDDMLCQACVTIHGRLSMSRDHTVEQLKSLTAERLTASRPAPCTTHSNKTSELYCPTHGACICHLCAASKHRACPEVTELEEKVAEARKVLSDLAATLSAGESELERAMNELDQHLIQTEKTTQTTLADIDAACNRLQSSVETCRRRLKELALSTKSKVAEAVSCGKSILGERRGKLTSYKRLVQRVKMTSPRSSVGEMASSLKSLASGLDRSTSLPENAKVFTKATLTIDPQALARIEKELAEIGKVNTVSAPLVTQPAASSVLRFHANHGRNITLSNDSQTAKRTGGDWHGLVVSREPMVVNTLYQPAASSVLRFHANHGSNITLRNDSQTAKRTGRFWYGLVVSREPMVVNTLYQARLEEIDKIFSPDSNIFVGIVTKGPVTQSFSGVICALHLSSAYIVTNTFVQYPGKKKVNSNVGTALGSVGIGDSVGVVVDAARCLHLYINGHDQGVACHDFPQPCFALFDLGFRWEKIVLNCVRGIYHHTWTVTASVGYFDDRPAGFGPDRKRTCGTREGEHCQCSTGYPAASSVLRFHANHGRNITLSNDSQTAKRTGGDWHGLVVSREPMVVNTLYQPAASSVLRFHANHGSNITLRNDSQTAKRTGRFWYGLVVSREPMVVNTLYQARLEEIDKIFSPDSNIFVGIVTKGPVTQSFSGVICALHLSSAYIVTNTFVQYPGKKKVNSNVGAALGSVGIGDSVGVVVDAARCLHLYINGQDQGVACHDFPQPCFALFDLGFRWEKVTGLPITAIN